MNAALTQNLPVPQPLVPADVNVLLGILDHYGFDHFLRNTLSMIPIDDEDYADAVDEALDLHKDSDYDLNGFTIQRAFRNALRELMHEEGFTREEALEVLADGDYVVPVTVALYYSVDAGDADVDRLSSLIRNRAKRLLRQRGN